ncbi:MAG TPA: hypothetical protein DCS19_01320 [Flavobacterium sp.]|nr:hypothetical protein [Flavobacterium sp.]
MKKFIAIILMLFAVAATSIAADRNLVISSGFTTPDKFTLNASDTIDASDVVTFNIICKSKFAQMQYFTVGLTQINATPNVVIRAWGKVTESSSWVEIGTYITWTTTANNGTISSTSPNNYNYLKVTFTATSASQKSKITTFEAKVSNAFEVPTSAGTVTFSRPTTGAVTITTKDDDANAAAVYRAGGTGALTIGSGTGTTAITSSDWAIGTTGIATNMGTYNGLTILNSIGRLVTTATAAADSTSTASMLALGDQFVTVTSGGATRCVTLPAISASTIGMVIEGVVSATGFDLRVATSQAMTAKINNVTGALAVGVEAAIPATTNFKAVCVSATEWVLTATDELGAVIAAIVPTPIEP